MADPIAAAQKAGDIIELIFKIAKLGQYLITAIGKEVKQAKETQQLQWELFGDFYNGLPQYLVGTRQGQEPSKYDSYACCHAFISPLFPTYGLAYRKFMGLLTGKQYIPLEINRDLLYFGGWRPLEDLETILRNCPFIFGEGDSVPSKSRMEEIRENPELAINWTVGRQNTILGTYKILGDPVEASRGTWSYDYAIITRITSPRNPNRAALALSGTHGAGGVGASLALSKLIYLKKLYEKAKERRCVGKNFQAILEFHFGRYESDNIPKNLLNVEVKDMELLQRFV